MIKLNGRYDHNAYRISSYPLSQALVDAKVEEGTWVTLLNGELVLPAAGKKAFILMGSAKDGRNQVAGQITPLATILAGPLSVSTDMVDTTKTFTEMGELTTDADGKLVPVTDPATEVTLAYSLDSALNDGFLRIVCAQEENKHI